MPDFAARLRKQLDQKWSNILIRRKSAEAILALIEAATVMRDTLHWEAHAALDKALRALDE